MSFTGVDRLARIWTPAAEAMRPARTIEAEKRLDRAIGGDGYIRADALPQSVVPYPMTWIDTGAVAVQINLPVLPVPFARCVLDSVHAYVFTAPTGTPMLIDIETNDNNTLHTLTIPVSTNYVVETGLGIDIEAGTWLRMTVTQVGSGTAGSNLSVTALLYPVEV